MEISHLLIEQIEKKKMDLVIEHGMSEKGIKKSVEEFKEFIYQELFVKTWKRRR
jgi:hypothetical protein